MLQTLGSTYLATLIMTVMKQEENRESVETTAGHNKPTSYCNTTLVYVMLLLGLKWKAHFSNEDMSKALHQVPFNESSSRLMIINTLYGLFGLSQFHPVGFSISPGIFEAIIACAYRAFRPIWTTSSMSWLKRPSMIPRPSPTRIKPAGLIRGNIRYEITQFSSF